MATAKNVAEQWTEKYRPQVIADILGNDANVAVIMQWFADFHARKPDIKRALLLSGPPGLGKTSLAHCLLRHFNYRIREYNASDIRSKKLVEANLHDMVDVAYVDRLFGEHYQRFGIIMDEVDGMSTGDKGGMAELIRFINPNRGKRSIRKKDVEEANKRWIPPIICICNTVDKKIKELKKDCLEISFRKPSGREMVPLVQRIAAGEGLRMTPAAQLAVAEMAQGDYRRLVYNLQNLAQLSRMNRPLPLLSQDAEITETQVLEMGDVLTRKDVDPQLMSTVDALLNEKVPCRDCLHIYESDKSLIPMMIHENYLTAVADQIEPRGHYEARFRCLQECLRNICAGDLIDKIMYNTQSWYLQPIHGLSSCYLPSYHLNCHPRHGAVGVRFTTALSKYSSHCSNQKNLNVIKGMIQTHNNYTNGDLHHFSQTVLDLLLDEPATSRLGGPVLETSEQCSLPIQSPSETVVGPLYGPTRSDDDDPRVVLGVKFLLNYGLDIKDLEKLNKMDKLNIKRQYSSKMKTHLGKIFQKHSEQRRTSEPTRLRYTTATSREPDSPIKWPEAFKKAVTDPRIISNDPEPRVRVTTRVNPAVVSDGEESEENSSECVTDDVDSTTS